MTRLEYWGKPIAVRYPEDVAVLKLSIPELVTISDAQVQDMYAHWSEEFFAAGWMALFDDTIADFKKWILADIDGPEILW